MVTVRLPDGSKREFDQPLSIMQVAESIGPGLAKATLAGQVNGRLVDASHIIDGRVELKIITTKDEAGLEIIRHSSAHLLAQAVKQLHPEAQVTIGPIIEDGFYYDFSCTHTFTPDDLAAFEKRMKELVKQKLPVERRVVTRDEAIAFFEGEGEFFKAEIIRDIPESDELTLYTQGDFTDLCRGPHVPHTGHLKVFKLLKVAGAYWRGDSNNEMLQRVYGTAWADKEDLKQYLTRMEEAAKRDHRKIGKAQGLFHMQEEAPGMVFWHDKGWTLWQVVEQYIRQKQIDSGYLEIKTPMIADISLWEKSGHKAKFSDEMFLTDSENRQYALKPMNCPCHVQVFNQGLKSYRDLPIRLAEFGSCHRNEPSGALHGLMRVRGFVQDDGHIFCTEEQIEPEVSDFMDFAFSLYRDFGFDQIEVKLATRPENRIGSDEVWDFAEQSLAAALTNNDIDFEYLPGEGAFYGPKIELHLKDCVGRKWQCGTMQLDFSMPERLGAQYVAEDSAKKTPYMLHRAAVGSMERFLGMFIEHCAGWFPAWLAPIQVMAMGVSEKHNDYCSKLIAQLKRMGFRASVDLRNEKIGFKIRDHTMARVPFQLIVGDQEVNNNTVSVRTREGEDLGVMTIESLAQLLTKAIEKRARN